MQPSFLTVVFLPIALGVIMLGLGLSLELRDFRRVLQYPRAVLVGLTCQIVLLPAVCFGIVLGFGLGPEMAVGLMLLAASPGGVTANLFSHLARADVALNITLTAVNSLLTLFTLPLIVGLSMAYFLGQERTIPLQLAKLGQVFAVVIIPVAIGMAINARAPRWGHQLARPVKVLSAVFLLVVSLAVLLKERHSFLEYVPQVGLAALTFNLVSLAVGYFIPLLVRLPRNQAVAIGMEIGVHNSALAIAIASSPLLLNSVTMAIPAAVYSGIMCFTAAAFCYWVSAPRPAPIDLRTAD
jgi:BASS family bile acid:Na+ symporter